MIILIVFTIILTLFGSILYLSLFRKPELIGFDKEIVLNHVSEVGETKPREILDIHTVGVVIAFFDQRSYQRLLTSGNISPRLS